MPIDDADPKRDLIDQIVAAYLAEGLIEQPEQAHQLAQLAIEHAWPALPSQKVREIARAVLSLFVQYRDGFNYDEPTAAVKAIADICESGRDTVDLAGWDTEQLEQERRNAVSRLSQARGRAEFSVLLAPLGEALAKASEAAWRKTRTLEAMRHPAATTVRSLAEQAERLLDGLDPANLELLLGPADSQADSRADSRNEPGARRGLPSVEQQTPADTHDIGPGYF